MNRMSNIIMIIINPKFPSVYESIVGVENFLDIKSSKNRQKKFKRENQCILCVPTTSYKPFVFFHLFSSVFCKILEWLVLLVTDIKQYKRRSGIRNRTVADGGSKLESRTRVGFLT